MGFHWDFPLVFPEDFPFGISSFLAQFLPVLSSLEDK